jgi:hypothetical protein
VQVHCDEGVATHIGPKPCAGICEDVGEASAGEHAGRRCQDNRWLKGETTGRLARWLKSHTVATAFHR